MFQKKVSEEGSQSVEMEDTDDESESPFLPHNLRDDLDDPHGGHHAAQAAIIEQCYCQIKLSHYERILYYVCVLFEYDNCICT